MKELRIATFARGSTNKQTSRGKVKKQSQAKRVSIREITIDDDLPLQKEMMRQFIDSQPEMSKGIKWVMTEHEYVEAGVSGFHTHVSKRRGLNQAFDDAKSGLFDILVIYKLDRFGRRSVESLNHAIKFLKHCRIWVVDKNREFTNNGDADEIMNFIEFWSAKKASLDTKIRVTDAMLMIHKEGYWTGGVAPYGYENHPHISNMLEVVPHEAEVVKQIYHMYTVDGFGMLKIAGILNGQGKRTKNNNIWKADQIRKILRNSIYMGHLSYGKTKTTEGEFGAYTKYVKEGEESISDRYWPEYDIVGKESWEKAQHIKKSRVKSDNLFGGNTPSRSRTGKGLLVGILKCECGSNMTYGTSSNWLDHKRTSKGKPYGIYRCLKRLKAGTLVCGAEKGQYKSKEMEELVIKTIKGYIKSLIEEGTLEDIKSKTINANKDMTLKLELSKRDVERYKQAKETSNSELMKIMMGEESLYDKEQLTELFKKASIELEKATQEYLELERLISNRSIGKIDIIRTQDLLNNWDELFESTTAEIKRQMIQSVVSEIKLKGPEATIEISFDIIRYLDSIGHIHDFDIDSGEYAASIINDKDRSVVLAI